MRYSYYQSMYMIPKQMTYTFEGLIEHLRAEFGAESVHILPEVKQIHINFVLSETWQYHLAWQADDFVKVESQDIAERYAKENPKQAQIASCTQRISGHGDHDPDMSYFDCYTKVMEVIEKHLKGCYLFDPNEGTLIET